MKNASHRLFLGALLVSCLAVTYAFGERPAGQRRGVPVYDTTTEVTVAGTVEEVKQVSRPGGWGGTHLSMTSDAGAFDVHIGPSSFLVEKGFSFAKGDQIKVTGSKVKYDGADALIAREIEKDGKVLTLRDAKGLPAWSRRNR